MSEDLARFWGPFGIFLLAIGYLFRRLDENHKASIQRENEGNAQRIADQKTHTLDVKTLHQECVREHQGHIEQLKALHEQRLSEHEQHATQQLAMHEQWLKQSKEMFDQMLSSDKNLKTIVWTSAKDTRELTESIKALASGQEENTRAIRTAIEHLSESLGSKS